MKILSERISILSTDQLHSIVILAANDKRRVTLLLLWLMAWTACGLIVLFSYFQLTERSHKLFFLVYLSFWAYFEFTMYRMYRWRKWGKEKIWIKEGQLYYQRDIKGKGKIESFQIELIRDLRILELRPTNLIDNLNQSFWVQAGERLAFDHQARNLRFGLQLSDQEAKAVLKEIKGFISR